MTAIKFKIIPPYHAAAQAANFDAATTLGIEVTMPALAAKCELGNIDHHGEGCTSATPSACEQTFEEFLEFYCYTGENPEATHRKYKQKEQWFNITKTVIGNVADADTLVSMAIIKIAENLSAYTLFQGKSERESLLRGTEKIVSMVGAVDRLGPASAINIDGNKFAEHFCVKAIMAISGSRSISLEHQMEIIIDILLYQEITSTAKKAVLESDRLFKEAKKASKVTVLDNGIVLVESSHHAASRIGYEHGDVLVCLNEKMLKNFKDPSAGTYRKFTVCLRDENIQAAINFDHLNILEGATVTNVSSSIEDGEEVTRETEEKATWGGRSTVGGSPQGVDSTLTISQVASCIDIK